MHKLNSTESFDHGYLFSPYVLDGKFVDFFPRVEISLAIHFERVSETEVDFSAALLSNMAYLIALILCIIDSLSFWAYFFMQFFSSFEKASTDLE